MSDPRCGTYAGWNAHYRNGKEPCDACKQAKREYQRAHRASHPERRAADRKQAAAYHAAGQRLRERHRDEFDRLYADERAARGLPVDAEVPA